MTYIRSTELLTFELTLHSVNVHRSLYFHNKIDETLTHIG